MDVINIREKAKDLKKDFELTDFEALTIASTMREQDLFVKANCISLSDKYPSALEHLAISIEEISKNVSPYDSSSIANALIEVADAIKGNKEDN